MQLNLPIVYDTLNDVRKKNVLASPKFGGSCDIDSKPYLRELGIKIIERLQPIQFTANFGEHVHRWAPYIQGFSASFVQSILDQYKDDYASPVVLDPFAGCGTVITQSKLNSYKSIGTELNPLLQFIANTKFKNTLQRGEGILLVPRDGILFIPFHEIQKVIIDDSKYKQNTIDIYINFKEDTIELTYTTNTIDVTHFRLLK